MRRFDTFALVLACLLTLSACGSKTGRQDSPQTQSPTQDSGENVTVYDCGGLEVALPSEYLDLLRVDTDFPGSSESWKPLISVYEKASYEAAEQDFGGGGGFLFGFLVMDQAAFEQHISSDGSGLEIFATDGEHYYAYTHPTDVQFYRSGGEISTESEDWKMWEKLNETGPQVREDFLSRNGLQSFSAQDVTSQITADGESHVCVRYYPYYAKDEDTRIYYQLLLCQPARQGEGGLWAVDQWLDEYGNQYLYFPDSGKPAAEYYAELQEECDTGKHPERLIPTGAAMTFVKDYFGHETTAGSFCEEARGIDWDYMERNEQLSQIALSLLFDQDLDQRAMLECVGAATEDNWGVLGRNMYGSDWFTPLIDALADAAVGEPQQWRDSMILSCLLATCNAQTDFRTPLDKILQAQVAADPTAFTTALTELSEEDQTYIRMNSGIFE